MTEIKIRNSLIIKYGLPLLFIYGQLAFLATWLVPKLNYLRRGRNFTCIYIIICIYVIINIIIFYKYWKKNWDLMFSYSLILYFILIVCLHVILEEKAKAVPQATKISHPIPFK
jgi:hypothetical protein